MWTCSKKGTQSGAFKRCLMLRCRIRPYEPCRHTSGVDDRMYAPLSHPVVQAEHRTEAAKQLRWANLNHGKAEHLHAIEYKEEMAALGGLSSPSLSCTKSGGWTMNPMSRCPPSHWCAVLVCFTLTTSTTPCRR